MDITGDEKKEDEGNRTGERRNSEREGMTKKKGRSQGSIPPLHSRTSSPGTGML